MDVDATGLRLLNDFQRDFPLCARPYRDIAQRLGESEAWVLTKLASLSRQGIVGRVGAIFAPNTVGASTLAALEVAPSELERVGQTVSGFSEVNHNYERIHAINLWFVVTAADPAHLSRALAEIERQTQSGAVLALPLVREYRLDLGFDLRDGNAQNTRMQARVGRPTLSASEQSLVAALQDGLPLEPRPYVALAARSGLGEAQVLDTLRLWQVGGVIRRFGIIVRHRPLGFAANAMAVWDVPDELTDAAGARLARDAQVSLCYRRERRAPRWNYNLYCMLHGREENEVRQRAHALGLAAGIDRRPGELLFSRRAFKQTGARYARAAEPLHA